MREGYTDVQRLYPMPPPHRDQYSVPRIDDCLQYAYIFCLREFFRIHPFFKVQLTEGPCIIIYFVNLIRRDELYQFPSGHLDKQYIDPVMVQLGDSALGADPYFYKPFPIVTRRIDDIGDRGEILKQACEPWVGQQEIPGDQVEIVGLRVVQYQVGIITQCDLLLGFTEQGIIV